MMSARNEALQLHGSTYHWDLETASFVIGQATFRLLLVGTVVGDSFLWSWANDAIPLAATRGIEQVRAFGVEHDLGLLLEPDAEGGLAQGKECLALAGRILDARAVWIDRTEAGYMLFALLDR